MRDDPPEGHLQAGTRMNLRVAGQYKSGLVIVKRKFGIISYETMILRCIIKTGLSLQVATVEAASGASQ
jgi:hypothetical protein